MRTFHRVNYIFSMSKHLRKCFCAWRIQPQQSFGVTFLTVSSILSVKISFVPRDILRTSPIIFNHSTLQLDSEKARKVVETLMYACCHGLF
jgi:hypothetical protein